MKEYLVFIMLSGFATFIFLIGLIWDQKERYKETRVYGNIPTAEELAGQHSGLQQFPTKVSREYRWFCKICGKEHIVNIPSGAESEKGRKG
jgi:hypothetical protein